MVIKTYTYRGDVVIDPYSGSGTTAVVAQRLGRRWVGIDLSGDYCAVAQDRLRKQTEALRRETDEVPKESDSRPESDEGDLGSVVAA